MPEETDPRTMHWSSQNLFCDSIKIANWPKAREEGGGGGNWQPRLNGERERRRHIVSAFVPSASSFPLCKKGASERSAYLLLSTPLMTSLSLWQSLEREGKRARLNGPFVCLTSSDVASSLASCLNQFEERRRRLVAATLSKNGGRNR